VIAALQTNMIQGGTSVAIAYVGTGLMEEAPYYTITDQQFTGTFVCVERKWFEGLDDVARDAIRNAMPTTAESRIFFKDLAAREIANAKGLTMHKLTAEQRTGWATAARTSHPEILDSIGGNAHDMYARIQELRGRYNKR